MSERGFDEATKEAIRAAYRPGERGYGYLEVARRFGVHKSTVRDIVVGRRSGDGVPRPPKPKPVKYVTFGAPPAVIPRRNSPEAFAICERVRQEMKTNKHDFNESLDPRAEATL